MELDIEVVIYHLPLSLHYSPLALPPALFSPCIATCTILPLHCHLHYSPLALPPALPPFLLVCHYTVSSLHCLLHCSPLQSPLTVTQPTSLSLSLTYTHITSHTHTLLHIHTHYFTYSHAHILEIFNFSRNHMQE